MDRTTLILIAGTATTAACLDATIAVGMSGHYRDVLGTRYASGDTADLYTRAYGAAFAVARVYRPRQQVLHAALAALGL